MFSRLRSSERSGFSTNDDDEELPPAISDEVKSGNISTSSSGSVKAAESQKDDSPKKLRSRKPVQPNFLPSIEICISSGSESSGPISLPKRKLVPSSTRQRNVRSRRTNGPTTATPDVVVDAIVDNSSSSSEHESPQPTPSHHEVCSDSEADAGRSTRETSLEVESASPGGRTGRTRSSGVQRQNQPPAQSRRRRRRRISSSSPSDDSSNDDEESGKKPDEDGAMNDSIEADEGEAEDDEEDKNGRKGRRKIRKILKDKKLSSETKTAEALERERRKRLEDRQKLYNSMSECSGEGLPSKSSHLVLDFDKDSNEALVEVHPDIVKHLKPHQVQAVRFLYDNLIESVDEHRENKNRLGGAILAHCMGLGKSLSTIAFIHTLLTNKKEDLGISTCLIICPVNTLLNWHREWRQWMPENAEVNLFELATTSANNFRVDVIRHWHLEGGVLLMGYDMYRNLTTLLLKRTRKQAFKKFIPLALIDPGPDIVVCDEGHLLKNCKTGVTKAINNMKTFKRIILTGTPLQNCLSEYWTMVNFVKPNLLGSSKEFANRFVNPIKNGQHSNSTNFDVQLMKKRSHVLFKTLDGCVQRKDYSCLTQYLPPRLEYVVKIRMSSVQCDLYRAFLEHRKKQSSSASGDDQRNTLFRDQQTLYRVWTHPHTLRMHETREAKRLLLQETSTEEDEEEEDVHDSGSDNSSSSSSSSSSDSSKLDSESKYSVDSKLPSTSPDADFVTSQTATASSRSTRAMCRRVRKNSLTIDLLSDNDERNSRPQEKKASAGDSEDIDDNAVNSSGSENGNGKPWWYPLYRDEYDLQIDAGAKLSALFFILKKCSEIGDKVLVFSQSLFSLDLIEWFLAAIDRQWCMSQGLEIDTSSKQTEEFTKLIQSETFEIPSLVEYFSDLDFNTWRRGKDYERIDGSLSAVQRNLLQTRFNSPSQRFRLLIVSTKAGGLGVNLTAANRLIIFDVSWNPSHDIQSIFRSYRFGQTKPVYIYRMIAQGTMEEKIYDRQVIKQSLALRVVDEQQIDRHFKEEDLRELYTFEPNLWDDEAAKTRAPPALPKDRLLADLLSEHPHLVVSYHDHDSLLENRLDEGLSEAERAEAWREYEEEKRVGRPMTDYQRLLLNNPEAAAALMVQRQQLEEEQRQRMAAMAAAYATSAAAGRLPYSSINPTPATLLDSMYTSVPAHQSEGSLIAPNARLPIRPEQRDIFSESFNAMRNMLISRYPMLARSPGALHDMTMRLFLSSVTNQVAAQNSILNPQSTLPIGNPAILPRLANTNVTGLPNPLFNSSINGSVVDLEKEPDNL